MTLSANRVAQERRQQAETAAERGCPECDGEVVREGIEDVCQDCGLVVDVDDIDRGPDWQTFESGDSRGFRRCNGQPSTPAFHDDSLGSQVQIRDLETERHERLRTWHRRVASGDGSERSRRKGHIEIARMTSALDLSEDVRERACVLFREAADEVGLPGRSVEGVAGAALWEAARQQDLPLTMPLLTDAARVGETEIGRAWSAASEQCGWESIPQTPVTLLPRMADQLDLSAAHEREARQMCEAIAEEPCTYGKSPRGIVAAVIYIVTDHETQSRIAQAADVSTVTIRQRYQEIEAALRGESA